MSGQLAAARGARRILAYVLGTLMITSLLVLTSPPEEAKAAVAPPSGCVPSQSWEYAPYGFWWCGKPTYYATPPSCSWPDCLTYDWGYFPERGAYGYRKYTVAPTCGAATKAAWDKLYQRAVDVHYSGRYTAAELEVLRSNPCTYPPFPKICRTGKVVEEKFNDVSAYFPAPSSTPHAYTVQFSRLNYCYDGNHVWFTDTPQFKVWISGNAFPGNPYLARYSTVIQGACTGVNRTDTDPTNTGKRTSIFVSCDAIFSNKQERSISFKAARDINGGSTWQLQPYWNVGVNLGAGSTSNNPTTDTPRRYTLQLTANNTYTVSGIGNPGASQMP